MIHSQEYAIVVEALTKRYGNVSAVNGISFTVRTGEVFAFLGPNGAGKTTTAEITQTLRTPTSGKVSVLGMDVRKNKRDILPRIGVFPQGFSSFDRITVAESIRYYARLFGCGHTDIDRLMDLTQLNDKRDVQFKNLSGGLKQRLGIAIALVNDPEVVFLDEPTTGLDPHARRAVWEVLTGLKHKGKTVFLTTHYMEEAELLADTVAIVSNGVIVAIGSPDQLIDRHADYMCVTLKSVDAISLKTIRRLNFETTRDSQSNIRIRVKHVGDVQEILSVLKGAGALLPGLDVRKPNLEEVYLSLTGEEVRRDLVGAGDGGPQ